MSEIIEPAQESEAEWAEYGRKLGQVERSVMWEIGDWWNRGDDAVGETRRIEIVKAPDWDGPSHGVCRVAGHVAARFPALMRINTLGFHHHRVVASLSSEEA